MSVADASGSADFDEGRYLYCVVSADGADFRTDGVENEPVYVVEADGIAAVVHACESLYDTDDPQRVRKWLLDHQSVVDAAGERFGTPLPFRFDTVIAGDDGTVREWLEGARDGIESHLADLADHWEYRVEVVRIDDPAFDDDRLDELRAEAEAADEGRSFLVEKQIEERKRELRRAADAEIAADARERLDPLARELDVDESADAVASFSLLAREDDERALGERLDAVAACEGIEVRFTGPWPPYSFAPEL